MQVTRRLHTGQVDSEIGFPTLPSGIPGRVVSLAPVQSTALQRRLLRCIAYALPSAHVDRRVTSPTMSAVKSESDRDCNCTRSKMGITYATDEKNVLHMVQTVHMVHTGYCFI